MTIINKESGDDLSSLFSAVDKINQRLDKIENFFETTSQPLPVQMTHPSIDKLNIAEAIADSIFSHYEKEKACQFEPGKPCDHCSMCNTRGF